MALDHTGGCVFDFIIIACTNVKNTTGVSWVRLKVLYKLDTSIINFVCGFARLTPQLKNNPFVGVSNISPTKFAHTQCDFQHS